MTFNSYKDKIRTRIIISGLYYSGSSAVIDFLKECDNVGIYPDEFSQFRGAGLIGDILNASPDFHTIDRTDAYISKKGGLDYLSISQNKVGHNRRANFHRFIDRLIDFSQLKKNTVSCKQDNTLLELRSLITQFSSEGKLDDLNLAKQWLRKIDDIYARRMDYVVYDQAIYLGKHDKIWPKIFHPYKLIVVIRNPLDQLAQLIRSNKISNDHDRCTTNGLGDIYGNSIEGNLCYHASAINARYEKLDKLVNSLPANSIFIIDFEDLILKYDYCTNAIINFTTSFEADIFHKNQKKYFKPEVSAKNLNIYQEYAIISPKQQNISECLEHYQRMKAVSGTMLRNLT